MSAHVSAHGRAFITHEEGCVLKVYLDKYNNPTCGVGHLCRPPLQFGPVGTPVSQATVDRLLAADLATVEAAIAHWIRVPLTTNQVDALASWLFNVGPGFANPALHSLPAILNRGDYEGAAREFAVYDVASGHHDAVLHARRLREAQLFLTPDGAEVAPRPPPVAVLDVRGLQHALNLAGASPRLVEDGAFGSKTRAAVVVFQKAHGLTPDGIVGTRTWAELVSVAA